MNVKEFLEIIMGTSFYLDEVIVIGPYPSAYFINEVLEHGLQKRTPTTGPELSIIVDDGWNQKYIEEIQDIIPSGRGIRQPPPLIRRVATSDPRGLVHAKIYFFQLGNYDYSYTKRYLLVGSANASTSGFGVHAETFINIDFADLDQLSRKSIEDYFKAVKVGDGVIAGARVTVGNKSWISLPPLRIVTESESGFDAWLRRGTLCHKYQSDQYFGKLKVNLLKPLPKTEEEKIVNVGGLGFERDRTGLSGSYVTFKDDADDETSLWRGKYFVETDYGYWASGECFSDCGKDFHAPNSEERESALTIIRDATKETQQGWIDDFTEKMSRVYESLNQINASEYFKTKNGNLDVTDYTKKAYAKLGSDRNRATDDGFAKRFISGYAFHHLPDLGDKFENFATCFCETLLIKMAGQRVTNKLALKLRDSLSEDSIPDTPVNLLEFIRSNWSSLRGELIPESVTS